MSKKEIEAKKREQFARIFPPRVDKLIDSLRILSHCSKSHCAWDQDLVTRTWIEIGRHFAITAKMFGVSFEIQVDGKDIREISTKLPLENKP